MDEIIRPMLDKIIRHLDKKYFVDPFGVEHRVAYLIYYAIYNANFRTNTIKQSMHHAYALYKKDNLHDMVTYTAFERSVYRAFKTMFGENEIANVKRSVYEIAFDEILSWEKYYWYLYCCF